MLIACFIYKEYSTIVYSKEVISKMQAITQECGEGYFASWLVLSGNKVVFKDIIGCRGEDNCSYSAKQSKENLLYNKELYIDSKCISNMVKSLDIGQVIEYNKNTCPSIDNILTKTILPIKELYLVMLKANNQEKHILAFSNTNSFGKCNNVHIEQILTNITI